MLLRLLDGIEWDSEGWGWGRTFRHGRVGSVVSVRVGRGLGGLIVEIRERSSPLLCLLENCDCQDSSSGCVSCLCIER